MKRIASTYAKVMILTATGACFVLGTVIAKGGEGRKMGNPHRPDMTQKQRPPRGTGAGATSIHSLNMKFKADRTTLRNEYKTAKRALLDKLKAGTITKAEFQDQKKTLIDQFKKDREALRNKYKLDKQELKAELKRDADEDREDLEDEKNEKPEKPSEDATKDEEEKPVE